MAGLKGADLVPTRGHRASLVVAWLALLGALAIIVDSQPWRGCAGEKLPPSSGAALLALFLAGAVVTVGVFVVVLQPVRPLRAFVVAAALYTATAGAVVGVALVWWGHRFTCAGG